MNFDFLRELNLPENREKAKKGGKNKKAAFEPRKRPIVIEKDYAIMLLAPRKAGSKTWTALMVSRAWPAGRRQRNLMAVQTLARHEPCNIYNDLIAKTPIWVPVRQRKGSLSTTPISAPHRRGLP